MPIPNPHSVQPINHYLEHTKLNPTMTAADVDTLVGEAKDHQLFGICVPPFWAKKAARELRNTDISLVTVIGFPLGYQMTQVKVAEIEQAIKDGAKELDIVMNISAFKSGMPWVKIELAQCAKLIHEHEAMMKVIIETAYLSDEEVLKAATLCQDAGTDFVKTSTGFAPAGAQLQHIKMLREHLSDHVGIKASGGIKNLEQARAFVEAGADRIGTSSGVQIMAEENKAN